MAISEGEVVVTALLRLEDNPQVLPVSTLENLLDSQSCESVIHVCDVPPPEKYLEESEEDEQDGRAGSIVFMSRVKDAAGDHFLNDDENSKGALSDEDFYDACSLIDESDQTLVKVIIDDDLDEEGNFIALSS